MDHNDWQSQQHRQRMPDTPPNQNARRYNQQPMSAPQQLSMQAQQPSSNPQYTYATPARSAASPSDRHSISSDFSGINIRDDTLTADPKSARPSLSVNPGGLRTSQGSVPSSPTRQSAPYNITPNYSSHPARTNSDEMRHFGQTTSTPRHSSPMHSASPVMSSPYYSTTPHLLNSIAETQQTMQWNQASPAQARQSPSRPSFAFPPSRDSVSPRGHLHQQSPSHNRHSMSHVAYDTPIKAQYSPRQATHFPGNTITTTPSISPSSYSPRHATFAMNRDAGSMMSDIVYSSPPPAKFRIVKNTSELVPIVNEQPKYRRANPDGGFISVCSLFEVDCSHFRH
jgi:dual specificity protein kinase YAK1